MNINLRLKITDLQRVQCCPALQKCINIKNLQLKSFIYFVSKLLLANLIKQEKQKTKCYEIILVLFNSMSNYKCSSYNSFHKFFLCDLLECCEYNWNQCFYNFIRLLMV